MYQREQLTGEEVVIRVTGKMEPLDVEFIQFQYPGKTIVFLAGIDPEEKNVLAD